MQRMSCRGQIGMVFSMTNASESNEVIAFRRGIYGMLTSWKAYATGGSGTGTAVVDPLQSQGSLILSRNGHFLFAVNAGSNSISSFRIDSCGALHLVDVEPSGGVMPNSLAAFGNLLFVTNVGVADNIDSNVTGFRVNNDGCLSQIIGSTYPLSSAYAQPACVVFSPDGRQLVVSEVSTNKLSVFHVHENGTLTGPTVNNASGAGPFGSAFLSEGLLIVSEAGANALSSYIAYPDGILDIISGSIPNGQTATCWVVPSRDEHFAFTSNTGSGTITTYRIEDNGTLSLVDIVYSTLEGIGAPIDSGVSKEGFNFYVLNGNEGSISVFCIEQTGQLNRLQVAEGGLPTLGAQGLAVL